MKIVETYNKISHSGRIISLSALLLLTLVVTAPVIAQNVGINATGATPNTSAILDLSPNTNGGFLLPTVTSTQLGLITAPPAGTLIFNSTTNCMEGYYSGTWQNIVCPCSGAPAKPGTISGSTSILKSTTGNAYSVTPVTDAVSYTWSIGGLGTIVGSSSGSSISVTSTGTTGTYTITVVAVNNCGTSSSSSLVVTVTSACSGVIALDNAVAATQQTTTVTITTSKANEVVLVFANGFSTNGSYSSTITVSGGSASAITVIKNSSVTDGYGDYTNSEMAGFIAATAATYTITVPQGNNNEDYNASAVALSGFCSTATIAANVTSATVTQDAANQQSSISNSITPTVASSYIVTNYYNANAYVGSGSVSWSSTPSGNSTIATDDNTTHSNSYPTDGSINGYAQTTAAAVTFKANDQNSGYANVYLANLQSVDVHN
jgi:hypothetical protein